MSHFKYKHTGQYIGNIDHKIFPSFRIFLCRIFGHLEEGRPRMKDGRSVCYFCSEILNYGRNL
jgi:hypothetical protein